ncbi:MAG: hypothetical protein WAW86_07575 [Gammaproteobacteria bacterium]
MRTREGHVVDLPMEMFRGIFNYLPPATMSLMLIAAAIDPKAQTAGRDYILWRDKLERHFPDRFLDLQKLEGSNPDWHAEFQRTYKEDYSLLSQQQKELFSLVKEGDVVGLEKKDLKLADFIPFPVDKNGVSLLSWI